MWVGKSDSTDEGVVYARSVRPFAEHSWSEENFRAVVKTAQKLKSTTLDIPPAADPLALPIAVPEVHEDEKEEPTEKPAEDEKLQGVPPDTTISPGASSSNRGEKRTETQEARKLLPKRKRLATKPSTEQPRFQMSQSRAAVEHGEHTHQRRDRCGNESLE